MIANETIVRTILGSLIEALTGMFCLTFFGTTQNPCLRRRGCCTEFLLLRDGRVQNSVEKLKFYFVSPDDDDLSVDFYII